MGGAWRTGGNSKYMKNEFEIRMNLVAIFLNRKNSPRLETVIDLCDLPKAQEFGGSWYAAWDKKVQSFYARANVKVSSSWTTTGLHQWLMGAPKGVEIDHKNHDTLNNTRDNLRCATGRLNMQNTRISKANKSGFRGVSRSKEDGKWVSYIMINKKKINLGRFTELSDAAAVAHQARVQLMPYYNSTASGAIKED